MPPPIPKKPGTPQLVTGERYQLFARIRRAEMECPRCGRVCVFGEGGTGKSDHSSRGLWNPRLHRFRCRTCGLTLSLGIIARRVPVGKNFAAPVDIVPTIEQALQLRSPASVYESVVQPGEEPVNVYEPGDHDDDDDA